MQKFRRNYQGPALRFLNPRPHFKSIKRDTVYKRDFFGERYCRVTSLIQSQEESGRTSFSREAPVGLAQPQFQCPSAFVASLYQSVEAPCTMVPRHFDHTLRHFCLLFCCPNYLITPQSQIYLIFSLFVLSRKKGLKGRLKHLIFGPGQGVISRLRVTQGRGISR